MEEDLYWPSKLLTVIRLHPQKKVSATYFALNILLFAGLSVLVVLNMFLDPSLESVESMVLVILPCIKYVILFSKRKEIKRMLESVQQFWSDDLPRRENEDIWGFVTGRRVYMVYLLLAATSILIEPIVIRDLRILFLSYIPDQIPLEVLFGVKLYLSIIASVIICTFNILFCTMIILLLAQFRRLNERFKNLKLNQVRSEHDTKMYLSKIKDYVKYHNFLITCVHRINGILSVPITLLIGLTTLLLCANMYIITVDADIGQLYRPLLTTVAVVVEFFFLYGLPAQLLMDEAATVSDSIYYHCDWYLPNIIPIRKALLMIMRRSQKPLCISGEGNILINNQTVVKILKTAYSFYTFLQTVT